MALFKIERYIGEEENKNTPRKSASTILEDLKRQAKLRKEKLKHEQSVNEPANKKQKLFLDIPSPEVEDFQPGQKTDETKTIKRKKKFGESGKESENLVESSDSSHVQAEGIVDNINIESISSAGLQEDIEDEFDTEYNKTKDESGFTILGKRQKTVIEKVHRVLPEWLKNPSIITADVKNSSVRIMDMKGLDEHLMKKLVENKITHFFPVQIQVIPVLLSDTLCGIHVGKAGFRPSDLCVSAPTGSGKTLAFVLPILQALKKRRQRRIRALVVLPVIDLAVQVFKVFQTYAEGTDIKIGLLVGQKVFSAEQKQIVREGMCGNESLVDVIVATPGRLTDHINQTEGLDLTHLRFLIIDEADKMMEHIKQDWLSQVEAAVYRDHVRRPPPGALSPKSCILPQIPLQKLLFSATLSQNPEKLQQLNLFHPRLFTSVVKSAPVKPPDGEDAKGGEDVDTEEGKEGEFIGKFTTPQGLSEFYVECKPATKPLTVLHFLHHLHFNHVLCFTHSVEASHRLYHLINLVGGKEVREFSSRLHASKRKKILQKFAKGKIDIIVCTDAIARGMDIENVKYVLSYDPPTAINNYIHRIGRTARAGKAGTAITLLEKKQFHHFKKMTRSAGKKSIKQLTVAKETMNKLLPNMKNALKELQEVLRAEKISKKKGKG